MVASCSAYNCQERYVKGGDITFHSFPKNEELKRKWVLLTRRQNFIPTQASKLCSKHFTSDCFDNDSQCQSTTIRKKTKLKQDAVPSIFNFPRFVNTLRNKRKLLQRQASPPVEQKKGWSPLNKEHSKVWLINFRKDDWKSSQLPQTCPQHLTASNFILCPDRNVKRPTTEHVSAVFNFPALLSDRTTQLDPPKEIPSPPDKVKGGSQLEVCRLCMGRQNKMTNLYGGEDATNSDLISRIMKCASIEVFKDDGLPPQVCECCLEKVNASYDFRLQCESSDSILRQQLVQLSTTGLPNEMVVIKNEPFSAEELEDPGEDFEDCDQLLHELDYNRVKDEPSCEDYDDGGDHKPSMSSTQNNETFELIDAKRPKLEASSEEDCGPTSENLTKLHISDPQVEKLIAQKFVKFSQMGFELTPEVMWKYAYQFALDKNIPHNFTKRMLKHHWHNKFLNRNPEVGTIIQDRSSRNKKQNQMWSRAVSFYDNLCRIYSRCGLFNTHPELVYNQGEIVLPLYHILAEEDRRMLRYQKKASSTVIVCANAAGELIPPLVVLKEHPTSYGDCPSAWPDGTVIVNTEDGLVNEAVIRVWLQHFERHKVPGKVLLTLDGQHSSKTMKIGDICMERDIELLLIPQLEMFALHPLHYTVLKTFKNHYVQKTSEWCYLNSPKTNGFRIPFPEMLTIAWDFTTSNQKHVSRGFVTSGIHPINPDIIGRFRQFGGGDPVTTVSSVVTGDLNDSSSPGEDSIAKENLVESKTNYSKDVPTILSPASSP